MSKNKSAKKAKKGVKIILNGISTLFFMAACVSVGVILASTSIVSFISTPLIGALVGLGCATAGLVVGCLSDSLSYKGDKYEKLSKQMKKSKGRSSILSKENIKSNENNLNKNKEKGKSFVEIENKKRMGRQQLEAQLS